MQQPTSRAPAGQRALHAPGTPATTWLDKNRGWVVSVGCLSIVMLGCLFLMSIFGVATTALKSSDAYAAALKTAQHDPRVTAELGSPLTAGWSVSGSVNVSGAQGKANLTIPISGSRRSGKIHAVAEKAAGVWLFSTLNVTIDGVPGAIDLKPRLAASASASSLPAPPPSAR